MLNIPSFNFLWSPTVNEIHFPAVLLPRCVTRLKVIFSFFFYLDSFTSRQVRRHYFDLWAWKCPITPASPEMKKFTEREWDGFSGMICGISRRVPSSCSEVVFNSTLIAVSAPCRPVPLNPISSWTLLMNVRLHSSRLYFWQIPVRLRPPFALPWGVTKTYMLEFD